MKSLLRLIDELVEQETHDAIRMHDAGSLGAYGGSDESLAARRAVEERLGHVEEGLRLAYAFGSQHGVELIQGNEE